MSRIGKEPVPIPDGVDVTLDRRRADREGTEGHPVAGGPSIR
jgi:ribosomal protein L6P/L9E